jgi:hypothetical protein
MSVKVKSTLKNKDINGLFNDMLGDGVAPPNIAYNKYITLKESLLKLITVLENFSKGGFVKSYKEYEIPLAEILVFAQKGKEEINKFMPEPPFNEMQILMGFQQTDLKIIKDFSDTYKKAKTLDIVTMSVKTCNRLIAHRKHILNKDENGKNKPDGSFINKEPGSNFQLLPFSTFNFKEAFTRVDMTEHYRNYILMTLSMVYETTYAIYRVYTSPDWDPVVFKEIMSSNIKVVRKQMPRCDKAFKKIEDSLDMLETNMDLYYMDFVSTKNPSIMLENFVNDVASDNASTDPETARQFRTIIAHYKKISTGKINDPRIQSLFDQVNNLAGDSISADRSAEKNEDQDDDS